MYINLLSHNGTCNGGFRKSTQVLENNELLQSVLATSTRVCTKTFSTVFKMPFRSSVNRKVSISEQKIHKYERTFKITKVNT